MEAKPAKPWRIGIGPIRTSRFGDAYSWLGSKRDHWAKIMVQLESSFEEDWFKWSSAVAACPMLKKVHPKQMRNMGWIEKQKMWVPGGYWRLTRSARTFAQVECKHGSHD